MARSLPMSRYSRQIAVPTFGLDGQNHLREARILVIGIGGLATPVLQYLVGAGLGHIRLVDPDQVELSNLHRQTLFREDDIGKSKAAVAAYQMAGLNSETCCEPIQVQLGPQNASSLCADIDLVVDCADGIAASYIASDYCLKAQIPLISASVTGTSGYCGGYCSDAPGLRALFPNLPEQLSSCEGDGVLGPTVGVIGSLQAQMVMAVLTKVKPSPLGQLVSFDANTMRFSSFRFDGAIDPDPNPSFISLKDVSEDDFLVDLRGEGETGPALIGALRHQVAEFGATGPTPKQNQRAVFACRTGIRAWQAADRLAAHWSGKISLLALGNNGEKNS